MRSPSASAISGLERRLIPNARNLRSSLELCRDHANGAYAAASRRCVSRPADPRTDRRKSTKCSTRFATSCTTRDSAATSCSSMSVSDSARNGERYGGHHGEWVPVEDRIVEGQIALQAPGVEEVSESDFIGGMAGSAQAGLSAWAQCRTDGTVVRSFPATRAAILIQAPRSALGFDGVSSSDAQPGRCELMANEWAGMSRNRPNSRN